MRQSDYPSEFDGENWVESDMICTDCIAYMWEADWYDDEEELGGCCIGTKYVCGDCGHYTSI